MEEIKRDRDRLRKELEANEGQKSREKEVIAEDINVGSKSKLTTPPTAASNSIFTQGESQNILDVNVTEFDTEMKNGKIEEMQSKVMGAGKDEDVKDE